MWRSLCFCTCPWGNIVESGEHFLQSVQSARCISVRKFVNVLEDGSHWSFDCDRYGDGKLIVNWNVKSQNDFLLTKAHQGKVIVTLEYESTPSSSSPSL